MNNKWLTSDIDVRQIEDVLNGHPKAFTALMDGYGDYVMRIVGRMVQPEAEAQEVVQDVFIGAYQSLRSYDSEKASFGTWLSRIAYHKAIDHLKRRGEPTVYIDEHEELIAHVTNEMANAVFEETTSERIEHLRSAVSRIPPDDQTLLHLYYTDDLPLKDIAYILDRPPGYLATRLQRIRKKLYIIIKELERHATAVVAALLVGATSILWEPATETKPVSWRTEVPEGNTRTIVTQSVSAQAEPSAETEKPRPVRKSRSRMSRQEIQEIQESIETPEAPTPQPLSSNRDRMRHEMFQKIDRLAALTDIEPVTTDEI